MLHDTGTKVLMILSLMSSSGWARGSLGVEFVFLWERLVRGVGEEGV